jgi:hypothetical protein
MDMDMDMDAYPEMIFGWCLLCILHRLRLHYPHTRILIAIYDYSDAYRRMARSASAAAQTIAVSAGLAFIALCLLSIGLQTCPPSWTLPSRRW